MEDVQFPASLPSNPLKRFVKVQLGRVVAALNPKYAQKIAAGELPSRLSTREWLLIAALVDRHERAGTLDELAPLHAWLWQGQQAVAFHAQAKERFSSWWLENQVAIVEPIRVLLDAPGSPYRVLCEIGCGSGLVIADLAERLPQLDELIGLDLSPAQTALNREQNTNPRLSFVAGDAAAWVPEHARPGTIYMTVAGVFEYFSYRSLEKLFAHVSTELKPAIIAVIEPIAQDYDLERETVSRPYGSEHSLGHNYILLLRNAGFHVVYQREEQLGGARFLSVVAVCS